MKKILSISTITCLLLVVINVGCSKPPPSPPPTGGTGSGGGSNNRPPNAKAGPDQTITLPANSVNLDGSGSTDPDYNISNYLWTNISGPASFIISNANALRTPITNLAEGTYQFELKVTDNTGLFSKDTVQVRVKPILNPGNGDVYIAGRGTNSNGRPVARIWNNSVLQDLSDGQHYAGANAVYVSGTDVYVAGFDGHAAILWKNGVAQTLMSGSSNGGVDVVANSVFVSGNDVYVTGTILAFWPGDPDQAVLWKNGVPQFLSSTSQYSSANSVFVSNNDVYVAGWIFDPQNFFHATIWKNGVAQSLPVGQNQYLETAFSVFVAGNNVYVAGISANGATVWQNGQATNLGSGEAKSIFVSGSDVFAAGVLNGAAALWKNGQATILGTGYASSVFIYGNDVYAVGKKNGNATLWKGSDFSTIQGLSEANSVFVN